MLDHLFVLIFLGLVASVYYGVCKLIYPRKKDVHLKVVVSVAVLGWLSFALPLMFPSRGAIWVFVIALGFAAIVYSVVLASMYFIKNKGVPLKTSLGLLIASFLMMSPEKTGLLIGWSAIIIFISSAWFCVLHWHIKTLNAGPDKIKFMKRTAIFVPYLPLVTFFAVFLTFFSVLFPHATTKSTFLSLLLSLSYIIGILLFVGLVILNVLTLMLLFRTIRNANICQKPTLFSPVFSIFLMSIPVISPFVVPFVMKDLWTKTYDLKKIPTFFYYYIGCSIFMGVVHLLSKSSFILMGIYILFSLVVHQCTLIFLRMIAIKQIDKYAKFQKPAETAS